MTEERVFKGPTETVKTTNLGTPAAFFSVADIHAYYAESYIIQGVSFNVHEGEILALLGRNGAGKTSTLRAIARCDDPEVRLGEIWLDHEPLHTMKAYQAAQRGVALVPEDRRIIQGLSVEENLILAQIEEPIGWGIERIYDLFPRLISMPKTFVGGIPEPASIAASSSRGSLVVSCSPVSPLVIGVNTEYARL